jgi:hypothetical protein
MRMEVGSASWRKGRTTKAWLHAVEARKRLETSKARRMGTR